MDIKYKLIRSNRRTYSIRVTGENEIIVRAPVGATVAQVENMLSIKRGWIEKVLAFNSGNALVTAGVKNFTEAYVCGRLMPVIIGSRNCIDSYGVHVTGVKSFRAAYINSMGTQFLAEFYAAERATGLKSSSVKFRSYKSMWGCCDGKCNISFNFKLLMLPVALQRYVIVHELCHTIHHDHSPAFWAAVARFVPRWKECRKELKKYSFIVKMY